MVKVLSELKYYNANANGKNVGDCSRRSISLAYGKPYEQVALDSRRLASAMGTRYQSNRVIYQLIKKYGYVWKKDAKDLGLDVEGRPTVGDVADHLPTGTYIVHCESPDKRQIAGHMVALIDGTLYDTWDSQKWLADTVVCISEDAAEEVETSDTSICSSCRRP